MALADVCGFSESIFKGSEFSNRDFQADITKYSSNFDNHYQLAAPPFENPCDGLSKVQAIGAKDGIKIDFDHGTTTLGFRFQGGVLLAVDSRATGGQYIGSGTMKKNR